jgi:hypothetical protein
MKAEANEILRLMPADSPIADLIDKSGFIPIVHQWTKETLEDEPDAWWEETAK